MIEEIREKIFELFDGPTLTQLATVNRNGRPWVRYVMGQIDDEMTVRIPTRSDTRKVQDVQYQPRVHLLVGKNLFSRWGAYGQFEGIATLTSDERMKNRHWNDQMRRYFSGPSDSSYLLIEVRPYRIEYWSAMQEENPTVLEEDDIRSNKSDFGSVADEMEEYWASEGRVSLV